MARQEQIKRKVSRLIRAQWFFVIAGKRILIRAHTEEDAERTFAKYHADSDRAAATVKMKKPKVFYTNDFTGKNNSLPQT